MGIVEFQYLLVVFVLPCIKKQILVQIPGPVSAFESTKALSNSPSRTISWNLLHALETVLGDTENLLAMVLMYHSGGVGLALQPLCGLGITSC